MNSLSPDVKTNSKLPPWLGRLVIGSVSVAAILLAVYVLGSIAAAVYQFGNTKDALMSRGLSSATADLVAWAAMLAGSAVPLFATARVVLGMGRLYDYALAMLCPLITWGITLIPANFDAQSGKALVWCAPPRPDGERYCKDGPGRDPVTGARLEQLDEQEADLMYRIKKNLAPKLIEGRIESVMLFDPLTGAPKVWYGRRGGGCVDLFDNPGVHPQTGDRLRPITRDIADQARQCSAVATPSAPAAPGKPVAAPPPVAAPAAPAPVGSRYVDLSVLPPGGGSAAAFRGDPRIATQVIRHLPQPITVSLFKPAFFDEGLFDRAMMGDGSKLRALGLEGKVQTVYLIRVGQPQTTTYPELQGATQSKLLVQFVKIDPRTGAVLKSTEINLDGKGFSPQQALGDLSNDLERQASLLN